MKRALLLVLALCLVVGAVGCGGLQGYGPVRPPMAGLLTQWTAPLSADNQGVDANASKVGRAEVQQFLGIVSSGDCSIEAAARNGGITTVKYVDYEVFDVLFGAYSTFTIVVHGD